MRRVTAHLHPTPPLPTPTRRPHSGRSGPEVSPPLSETWAALEALVSEGKVRSIGMSNFSPKKVEAILAGAKITPAVLQVRSRGRGFWCVP